MRTKGTNVDGLPEGVIKMGCCGPKEKEKKEVYKCKCCGKTSDGPGNCCDKPMKKVS